MSATFPVQPLDAEVVIGRLFEIGMVEWIGIAVDVAVPFLFAQAALCGMCGQRRWWFILRDGETCCEICDRARRPAA